MSSMEARERSLALSLLGTEVPRAGFEPAASALGERRSFQLSYRGRSLIITDGLGTGLGGTRPLVSAPVPICLLENGYLERVRLETMDRVLDKNGLGGDRSIQLSYRGGTGIVAQIVKLRALAGVTKQDETALEDRILVEALGELGAAAGGAGGLLGGGLGGLFGGRSGGRRGASAAAGRLRADRCELRLEAASPPEAVLGAARQLLAAEGRLLEDDEIPAEPPQVWALVGSGGGGFNPALVRVLARPRDGGAAVEVRGVAKEGMVKQRGGQRAAAWVRDQLRAALGPDLA